MSWTQVTTSWPVAAGPAEIFAALTDPARLERWFADEVEVDPKPGGAFRFWGRCLPGTPSAPDATQRLTEFVPGERIAFVWTMMGVGSTVTLRILSDGKESKLEATHAFAADLGVPRQRELVDDFWRLAFCNLAAHLSGGTVWKADFSDPRPELRLTRTLDAAPADVFRALMEPDLVNQWTGSTKAAIDVAASRYSYGWEYEHEGRKVLGGPTRILELVPGRRLALDWPDWRGDAGVPVQRIAFTLSPAGDGTRLDFEHTGFTRTADISDYPFGWDHFLREIGRVAAAL